MMAILVGLVKRNNFYFRNLDCSDAFGGAFSDRQIVERSNLVERLDPKDTVMLDKGYDIIDLFLPRGIRYAMPTKFRKKPERPVNKLFMTEECQVRGCTSKG